MARLSNIEKYTIQGMIINGKLPEDIAKAINRPEKIVTSYIETLDHSIMKIAKNITNGTFTHKRKRTEIIHESAGKRKGVTVMTEAASQKSDAFREKNKAPLSRLARKNVAKIFDEEE